MRRIFMVVTFLLILLGVATVGPKWTQRWSAHALNGVLSGSETYASYQFHTLKYPTGISISASSSALAYNGLYIGDSGNNVIRWFNPANTTQLQTIAGNGTAGYVDGAPTQAEFNNPTGIGRITSGLWFNPNHVAFEFVYFSINDAQNYVVRSFCGGYLPYQYTPCTKVTTSAGNHTQGFVNGAPSSAEFSVIGGNSTGSDQNMYLADGANNAIRVWNSSGIATFAGTGTAGFVNGYRTSAQFNAPTKVAWDASGNMYVVDAGNNAIRKIDTSGNVTTFAGSGTPGFADGPGWSAQFYHPGSIVFNSADNYLYVADSWNNRIRRIDLSGNVSTYTGMTPGGLVNGSLSQAQFACPMDLVISAGFMYISDSMNNVIRRIDMTNGVVSTYIS